MPALFPFNRHSLSLSSVTSHRVVLYSTFSLCAVLSVIVFALRRHSNFYSIAVHLSKSNGSVVVLGNFTILLGLIAGKALQRIFFGELRTVEVERLYDRMWFFITESLLAFTIFRDEFDIPFALMFGILLFTKCFHWLLADRIEWMDQRPYPGPPLLFHLRMNVLMAVLWITDAATLLLAIESMLSTGVGGTVLFASEYGILLAGLMNSALKYYISMVDLRRASTRGGENAPAWEDKSMYVFYVDLVTDFVKLVTYMTFFVVVLTFYGLPLNIIRDVYVTARSFIMRLRDLMRYRSATRNMDERYPSASVEELTAMSDRTCIICREEMVVPESAAPIINGQAPGAPANANGPNTTPKKLPCEHVFHFHCLRSWLERQQSCPTCRRSVLEAATPQQPNAPGPEARPQGAGPAAAANGNDAAPVPNGLRPPQEFQGFWAPGGVWQPWPQAPAAGDNIPPASGNTATGENQREISAREAALPRDRDRRPGLPYLIPLSDQIPRMHQHQQTSMMTTGSLRSASRNINLRSLPSTLTDQQLATLDRLTREAIDERLVVLEDVQNVASRSIEQLLRLRSVLPRSTTSTHVSSPSPPADSSSSTEPAAGPSSESVPVDNPEPQQHNHQTP